MANLFVIQEAFAAGDAAVWPDERVGVTIVIAFVVVGFLVSIFTRNHYGGN